MERCPHCGEKIRPLNPHRMDKSKVHLLERIARLNSVGYPWVKVQRDGALIKRDEAAFTIQCDDVHALRLTWFGLAERESFRSGLYRATLRGYLFLCGRETVPETIYCKDGAVIEQSITRVTVSKVRHVIFDKEYWDNYAELQVHQGRFEQQEFAA